MRILLLLLLTSCGIIESQKEIISVETIPSGVEVYKKADKSYVGKTPFFLEVEKNSTDAYNFKYSGLFSSKSEIPKEYCDYKNIHSNDTNHRTVDDVIDGINPVTLVKGAKYECINAVRAKLDFKKPAEDPCKTVVVIPPKSNFYETSLEIFEAYKKVIFDKNKKACDKIISPFQAEEYFLFLGIDHIYPPEDINDLDHQKIFKIGYKFKATHILFLTYEGKENLLKVFPKIYNIHEGIPEDNAFSKSFSTTLKEVETNWLVNFFLSSFRLIPNGVGILANTANKFDVTDSSQHETSHTYDSFELGITLDDIQYPAEKWAFNFRTVPVLVFTGWGNQVDLKVSGLTLDFKIYIHLPPGGVFVARAGLGGAYLDISYPPENYNSGGLSFMTDVGIEFYFFPTERIYAGLGYKKYFLPNDSVSFNGDSITGQSHVFFELGYFWPELRMGARSLFK